jgi:co-chaperonin GroES (HSP10)
MKKKIDLVKGPGYEQVKVRKIVGAKPTGTYILVEKLTESECNDSPFFIPNSNKSDNSNQAYVVEVGPALEKDKYNIKKGDRVWLTGTIYPLPATSESGRDLAIVGPFDIKAVLVEEGILEV